jgi:hypothetical protein
MCDEERIDSIEAFMQETKKVYKEWGIEFPWFRGEPASETPLVPRLYRKKYKNDYYENRLLQYFRTKAPSLWYGNIPGREHVDQWLFLARHVGLPTRLLDWTEGSLIGLYFALQEKEPIVWMLNPFALNDLSISEETEKGSFNIYPLTWYDPRATDPKGKANIGFENIAGAWQDDKRGVKLAVAVQPTNIHPRMTAQRSCLTVHGLEKKSLCELLSAHAPEKNILRKYIIDSSKSKEVLEDLRILGVSRTTLFPELEGLTKDLTELFRPDLAENQR